MNLDADVQLFARDVLPDWRRRVKRASKSVVVFTPYFDYTVGIVLRRASHLPRQNVRLVTTWDVEALLQTPAQLTMMKRLVQDGFEVRVLDGLHAKLLLTDDSFVTVGSQNFTSRGRKNKEASVVWESSVAGTTFAETLLTWLRDSEPIDEGLIDELLEHLTPKIKLHCLLITESQQIADRCRIAWRERREAKRRELEEERTRAEHERLRELEMQSRVQLRGGAVYASLKEVGQWDDRYDTLSVYSGSLTAWVRRTESGKLNEWVQRLRNYPAYFSDSGRMGFVRVAKRQITFVRDAVRWSEHLTLGTNSFGVEISFSQSESRVNAVLELTCLALGSAKFLLNFTPFAVEIVDTQLAIKPGRQYELTEAISSVSNVDAIRRVLCQCWSGFLFEKRLGEKNIQDFVGDGWYRISAVEFESTPLLVISKHAP